MPPSDKLEHRDGSSGFALLEALVALSVVAVVLVAIGGLVATNVRTTADLGQRLTLIQTARAILADLPDRSRLDSGAALTGERGGNAWRIDVMPFSSNKLVPPNQGAWAPEHIVIQVKSPSGQSLRLDTVRLRPNREAK